MRWTLDLFRLVASEYYFIVSKARSYYDKDSNDSCTFLSIFFVILNFHFSFSKILPSQFSSSVHRVAAEASKYAKLVAYEA